MISEKALNDDLLEEVNGGVSIHAKASAIKTIKVNYMKVACPQCGYSNNVDVNNKSVVRCKNCNGKIEMAG